VRIVGVVAVGISNCHQLSFDSAIAALEYKSTCQSDGAPTGAFVLQL
jgi:hypothetical protein